MVFAQWAADFEDFLRVPSAVQAYCLLWRIELAGFLVSFPNLTYQLRIGGFRIYHFLPPFISQHHYLLHLAAALARYVRGLPARCSSARCIPFSSFVAAT